MKELKEEAKRSAADKLERYKHAHGGRIPDSWENSKKDKTLDEAENKIGIKEGSKDDEKIDRIAMKHRADGGPIAGSGGPKLGRGRKGKGKGTNVSVNVISPKGPDAAPALPPPALGAGPAPIPAGPKPPLPAGPMKKGGAVKSKHRHK